MPEFNEFIKGRNLYENAFILPGAIEAIKKLNEIYEIFICSSCINPFDLKGSGKLFNDKYNLLFEKLPFINPSHYIFTSAKYMFKADVQIDDRLSNFDEDIETKILFPSYHNKEITEEELKEKNVLRAGYDWRKGWEEVEKILIGKKENEKYRN